MFLSSTNVIVPSAKCRRAVPPTGDTATDGSERLHTKHPEIRSGIAPGSQPPTHGDGPAELESEVTTTQHLFQREQRDLLVPTSLCTSCQYSTNISVGARRHRRKSRRLVEEIATAINCKQGDESKCISVHHGEL